MNEFKVGDFVAVDGDIGIIIKIYRALSLKRNILVNTGIKTYLCIYSEIEEINLSQEEKMLWYLENM